MKRLASIAVLLGLVLGVQLFGVEAIGPPKPVPYKAIPDPPDVAERHIVVKAEDRGPVWLLTGFLGADGDICRGLDYEVLARVKPRHLRTETWPFWSPCWGPTGKQAWGDYRDSAETLGRYLDTVLRLRRTGTKWQLILHFKGRYVRWLSFVNTATQKQLAQYGEHIFTLVKYCRDMGLPVDYWEVTNEPAHPYNTEKNLGGYFKQSWQDFLAYWDANYDAVRAANPEAKLVGPSFGGATQGTMVDSMDAFLAHCKKKGQKLDVLSWHINCIRTGPNGAYWDEVDSAWREIDEVRRLVETKYPLLGIKEYHIDEWGYYLPQTGMGAQVAYFYYMDLAGVDRAAKTGPPYVMSGTRISPRTPRAAYWMWVEYAKQEGGTRLVTTTDDRNLVCLASRHDDEKIIRALVGRAKHQAMADPPETAPPWKWGDHPPAKPPVVARVDIEGIPLEGRAEVTILRLPPGTGPLYEDELDALTTTKMMNVKNGSLTIRLGDVAEDNVFSIVIGPKGTRAKEKAEAAKWTTSAPPKGPGKSERKRHEEATAKAEKAAGMGVIRIACGAYLAFVDPKGKGWFADREYEPGGFGHVGGGMVDRGPIKIEGTDNPELYRTELWGMKAYRITLPKGKYRVRLHWAETYGAASGGRTFDVVAEGKTILKDFDATREAGGIKKAVVKEVEVTVTDGVLDLEFPHKEGVTPMINGIEVLRR